MWRNHAHHAGKADLWGGKRPQVAHVYGRHEEFVHRFVKISHADLTEVTRVAEARQTNVDESKFWVQQGLLVQNHHLVVPCACAVLKGGMYVV